MTRALFRFVIAPEDVAYILSVRITLDFRELYVPVSNIKQQWSIAICILRHSVQMFYDAFDQKMLHGRRSRQILDCLIDLRQ